MGRWVWARGGNGGDLNCGKISLFLISRINRLLYKILIRRHSSHVPSGAGVLYYYLMGGCRIAVH